MVTLTRWYDDPELSEVFHGDPDPAADAALATMYARTEAAMARLRDDRGEVFVFDAAQADAWLNSYDRQERADYDPEVA